MTVAVGELVQPLADKLVGFGIELPEGQILQLLAQGKRNDDIASELYISPQTVQTHVRNILGKLRVHSKLEAVAFAVKHGAIQVS